jgi:peptidoglycan lytic transglycosylase
VGPHLNLRAQRARVAVLCALAIGIASAAVAPIVTTAARAQAQPAMRLADASIRYGQTAVVSGSVGVENARRTVALEFSSERTGWRVIKTASATADGDFRFRAPLRHTGHLRVALGEVSAIRAGDGPVATSAARSASQRVTVSAHIPVPYRKLDVLAGHTAVVRGTVQPWRAGRLVRLEVLRGKRWRAVDHDRTDGRGRYALSHVPRSTGSRHTRVTFPGDAANGRAVRRIGTLHAYRGALASRYDLYGGALACGGSLGYHSLVVAHKTLPCGTKVRVRYRGRVVTATVRDRGPYAGGREYDLAGAVARRLGFNGVGTIWVTR